MPDFQCLPLPAASDFGQGFLMSAESPQIPGAHRAFAGGSAFPGRSPPCRTGRRARPRLRPGKAVAADKLRGEMRWVPRGQRVRRRFVKRRSDTGGAWDGEQHPDGREIYPEPVPPDREQPAQVSLQTAAGDLRVAPDGGRIRRGSLYGLQKPRVATARRFAEQISAVKFRRRHSARREQVQLRGGFSFSSSKPAMPHFKAEPGGNGYRIMDKPPFL